MVRRVVALWRGEIPLDRAFWDWAIIGGAVVNLSAMGVSIGLTMHNEVVLAVVLGHGLPLPYNLLAGVGVWRSASRHSGDDRWRARARITAAIYLGILSLL